jgi:hypothetical protein
MLPAPGLAAESLPREAIAERAVHFRRLYESRRDRLARGDAR